MLHGASHEFTKGAETLLFVISGSVGTFCLMKFAFRGILGVSRSFSVDTHGLPLPEETATRPDGAVDAKTGPVQIVNKILGKTIKKLEVKMEKLIAYFIELGFF